MLTIVARPFLRPFYSCAYVESGALRWTMGAVVVVVCLGLLLVYLAAHIVRLFLHLCGHVFCSKSFQEGLDATRRQPRTPPTRAVLTQQLMTPTTTVSGSSNTSGGGRVARVVASVPANVLAEAITVVEAQPVLPEVSVDADAAKLAVFNKR